MYANQVLEIHKITTFLQNVFSHKYTAFGGGGRQVEKKGKEEFVINWVVIECIQLIGCNIKVELWICMIMSIWNNGEKLMKK